MKTALITGGAQRIGKTIAAALAEDGYALALHFNTSQDDAQALAAALAQRGQRMGLVQADLSRTQDVETLMARATASIDAPITCLINNASTFTHDTIRTVSSDAWDTQLTVNLKTPALLSRDFAAQLPDGTPGNIINILDQRIQRVGAEFLSYSVSKVGLAGLTETLAIALAPQIRVNGVAPGLTLPSGQQSEAQFAAAQAQNLLGRGPAATDIADAVRYLLQAEAVTGQILYVDGGERYASAGNEDDIIGSADKT